MRMNLKEQLLTEDKDKLFDEAWYDWFCADSELRSRGEGLMKMVERIAESDKFDNEKVYVWFKNNCPVDGDLYDDFRIADLETGDVLYTVVPRSGFTSEQGMAYVWGAENNFDDPLHEGSLGGIYTFFGV